MSDEPEPPPPWQRTALAFLLFWVSAFAPLDHPGVRLFVGAFLWWLVGLLTLAACLLHLASPKGPNE